jgi:hypothetical protein
MNTSALSVLTTLPPEIRNRIYEFLFIRNEPVDITTGYPELMVDHGKVTRLSLACTVALLRTCRQIYHEAVGLLYSQNRFTLVSLGRTPRFFQDWSRTMAL